MDTRLKYQDIIKSVLQNHADYRTALLDGYASQVLFDDERGQYLVLDIGWNGAIGKSSDRSLTNLVQRTVTSRW